MLLLAPNGSVIRIFRYLDLEFKWNPMEPNYHVQDICEVDFLYLCRMDKIYQKFSNLLNLMEEKSFEIYDSDTADYFITNLLENFIILDSDEFHSLEKYLTPLQIYLNLYSHTLCIVEFIKLNKINTSNFRLKIKKEYKL